jgi:hypothetical protein
MSPVLTIIYHILEFTMGKRGLNPSLFADLRGDPYGRKKRLL